MSSGYECIEVVNDIDDVFGCLPVLWDFVYITLHTTTWRQLLCSNNVSLQKQIVVVVAAVNVVVVLVIIFVVAVFTYAVVIAICVIIAVP